MREVKVRQEDLPAIRSLAISALGETDKKLIQSRPVQDLFAEFFYQAAVSYQRNKLWARRCN